MMGLANRLANRFESMKCSKPQNVAAIMAKKLNDFRPFLPIIRALCNPGLQDRHISKIIELIRGSEDARDIGNQKLDYFKSLNIENFKHELEEISETASKEYSNMNTMGKMQDDWKILEFRCKPVPDKDSYILDGEAVEEIQTILDDHIIKT